MAESIQESEVLNEPRRILTSKAIVVGVLAVVGVNLLAPFSEWIVRSTHMTTNYFPLGLASVFIFLVVVINPALKMVHRRGGLSGDELGVVYIGGSGYSNFPVYQSSNHGVSFQSMSAGLPNTLVFQLATSDGGELLFAATEVGPYVYDVYEEEWFDLAGLSAPDQTYWSLEYVPEIHTARFGTYGRGIWDFIIDENIDVSYGDLNQNGSYDIGEPVYDYGGGEVYINPIEVSDVITYSDNLPSDVYVLELTVTDTYGDSDQSVLVVGIEGERNEEPSAYAGDNQTWYMPTDQDTFDISMSSHSVDDTDSDYLTYGWDLDGAAQNSVGNQTPEYSEVENDQALAEGDHVFTLTVSDSYGETASDSFTITVLDEPAPVAVGNLSVDDAYNAFKQVQISWEEGVLASDFGGAYTGDLHNTLYFVVSMNGEEDT